MSEVVANTWQVRKTLTVVPFTSLLQLGFPKSEYFAHFPVCNLIRMHDVGKHIHNISRFVNNIYSQTTKKYDTKRK